MAKRRGNPNWGKPELFTFSNASTSFDTLVKTLGLSPDQYQNSIALREWVGKYKDHKYVPVDLLTAWGFKAESEV
jgi:hypothetical protein